MQAVTEGVALIEEELPAELSFYMPERFHKQAIGAGGKRIQTIMRRREAFVKFSSSDEVARMGGFDVGDVGDNVIVRTPARNTRNMDLVRRDVEATVGFVDPTGTISPAMQSFVNVTIRIPRRHHRRILARAPILAHAPGEEPSDVLSEIEERTGSKIRFPERELGQDDVTIEGPQHGVEISARVLAALVPTSISIALPVSASLLLRSPDFQKNLVDAVAKEDIEVFAFVTDEGGRERSASFSGDSRDSGVALDGQPPAASQARAVGYRGDGSELTNELLFEGDDPQRLEQILNSFVTPWFAERGVTLPARQPIVNFGRFDYRILESVIQRNREGPRYLMADGSGAGRYVQRDYQRGYPRRQRPLSEYRGGAYEQRGAGHFPQAQHTRRTSEPPPEFVGAQEF
ncbi:hypothetical protein HDU93_004723, partial [Gonapodya sp. JEL0774]